ncbi:MAG: N-acetylmuramoyl-L-alanine amidase, partial [Thermomicrobiales bacterium]|nr:N-acetylmuramoyl-L-alanine amidase [Thermomicrobiales bacterium]
MCRSASSKVRAAAMSARLGRRDVLRFGAGAAMGAIAGGRVELGPASLPARSASAAPLAQAGGFIQGGRWSEVANFGLAQRADPAAYISFAADFPFDAVAPSWSGEGDPGAVVEILWSQDGVAWSDPVWITRAGHDGPPDRDGRVIGELTPTPGGLFLQYRTYDGAGNVATLPGFELDYIDASAGATLAQVADPATSPVFAMPPIITRAGWAADESLRFDKNGREIFPVTYQAVEHVIIHHADTANFNDPVLEMRSIYYFHAITRGWGDIAYNYLVDFMGNVYEGRVGGENAVGCHAEGYNAGSAGICLMGRFFDNGITPEMHNAIVWIASWAGRNLDPTVSAPFKDIPDLPTICGHRDVNNTSCPGEDFYVSIPTVRTEVRRVIRGRDDPAPPPAQWPAGTRVITNADGVILRAGPSADFDRVSNVVLGERLMVIEGPTTNDGDIWYHVQGVSLTGWIAGHLLSPDPNPDEPWPTPVPTQPPAPVDSGASPDTGAATPVEEPPPGAAVGGEVDQERERRGGRRSRERRQDAWLLEPGAAAVVAADSLNLRSQPGLWADVVAELPAGYPLTIASEAVAA